MKGKSKKCREIKSFLKLDFDSINHRKKNSNSIREKEHGELIHTIGKLGNAAMSNTLGICTEIKGKHKFENDGEIKQYLIYFFEINEMAKDTTILPNTTTENKTDIRTIMCSIQGEYHQNLSYTV